MVRCPLKPEHLREEVPEEEGELRASLIFPEEKDEVADFTWTDRGECLVTEAVLQLFRQAGFTGFEPRRVLVETVAGDNGDRVGGSHNLPELWHLFITGRGGEADPQSGIELLSSCEACGFREYSDAQDGIRVAERNWDGTDFFTVNGYPGLILITERVRDLIVTRELENCALTPAEDWKA